MTFRDALHQAARELNSNELAIKVADDWMDRMMPSAITLIRTTRVYRGKERLLIDAFKTLMATKGKQLIDPTVLRECLDFNSGDYSIPERS